MKLELHCAARASGRSADFAAGIAERHGIARAGRGAERVLRAVARASIATHVQQLFALRFSPHIALAISHAFQALRPGSTGTASRPGAAGVAREFGMGMLRHEVLTTRLVEREVRHSVFDVQHRMQLSRGIESLAAGRRSPAAAAAGQPRAAARVFAHRRSVVTANQVPPAHPAALPRTLDEGPLRHLASAAPSAQAINAAIDVNRLTRDVMRGIDERIVAHRERVGRA